MSTAAHAQAGRDRARERRLQVARERRRQPIRSSWPGEQRIDEATVDVELAWEARAERAMDAAGSRPGQRSSGSWASDS